MNDHLLSIEHLSVKFGNDSDRVSAIRDVSLYLDSGEILSVVGESGCGKSVTAKSVIGLLPINQTVSQDGIIRYRGVDLLTLSEKQLLSYRGQEIAMISQDSLSGLNPTMTVGKQICESIMTHRKISWQEAKTIAIEKMEEIRLPEPNALFQRYPHTLSGGQRQRVMITMAIACDPKLVIADEPTTALDPTVQTVILDILRELRDKRHIAVMLITHDLRVASAVADRIAVMYAGSVVETGSVEELFQQPAHPYTWGLLCSVPSEKSRQKSMLRTIKGAPPEPGKLMEGCSFLPRCPYAMKVCAKFSPPVFHAGGNHSCNCWLLDHRSPRVRAPEKIWLEKGGEKDDI